VVWIPSSKIRMLTSITSCMRARAIPTVTNSIRSFMTHAFTSRAKSWWKLFSHTIIYYPYTYLNYPPTIHYNTWQHLSALQDFWISRIIGKGEKLIAYDKITRLWEVKEPLLSSTLLIYCGWPTWYHLLLLIVFYSASINNVVDYWYH
jgi:hypothetical protein